MKPLIYLNLNIITIFILVNQIIYLNKYILKSNNEL